MKLSPKKARTLHGKKLALEAKCKELYGEIDALEAELIAAIRSAENGLLPIGEGQNLGLKNNFVRANGERQNKAFKTVCVKEWEITVV